ncbi:hypothetical protein KAFR_0D02350 [Kazachstania africana CBS 2517]|uniref:Zinc/iron permease n=1 Tax=Kazachstania africana (strain ATCC 22294 / BCRC 22015 / CBS 2517 / CECT 1963 / NBRC 1671 / NRRL Y-8276) TaxID=1071382 RepID=H2AU32_KAZAF|nr:hypothetical protein KAFR_0D02350 [Kazachstania africana CBS 2517]CCF57882.1 hypothetical protein KAFR_0D02350 [Kazachstania africana CBS 2517]
MAIGLFGVICMAAALLVATFAIGMIPIYSIHKGSDSRNHEKYIAVLSQFGVGMLLGTSFMLVIPEGIRECVENGGNVGLNLLIGFLVVYLLDRLVQFLMKRHDSFSSNRTANESFENFKDLISHPKRALLCILRNNVVFALFIHGVSDGVALGTTVNNDSLMVVVLIAIIIHKIPAVLSLTSLMVSKQGLPKWEAISNLFAFASSTPIGYIVLSLFNLKHSETMSWVSGNLLLMSGGSLLYASFTAFLDNSHDHTHGIDTTERTAQDIEFGTRGYNLVPTAELENGEASKKDVLFENEDMQNSVNPGTLQTLTGLQSSEATTNESITSILSLDDSVYILMGVVVPLVISFCIKGE